MERLWSQLAPRRQAGEIAAVAVDAVRSRRELVLENAVLRYFNKSRPHQGLGQRIPADPVTVIDPSKPIAVKSVLGELHVDYRRAA
jgi:hypothetical protein